MKSFKFRYSITVWVLLNTVLILSAVGIVWNIFNLIEYSWAGAIKIIPYALLIIMTTALFILVLSVMLYGRYVIKGGYIYTYFGLIKNKSKISDVLALTHFKKSDKLVMYFKDEKYTVIVINPEEYEKFILSIREINRSVIYDAKTDGEDTPE